MRAVFAGFALFEVFPAEESQVCQSPQRLGLLPGFERLIFERLGGPAELDCLSEEIAGLFFGLGDGVVDQLDRSVVAVDVLAADVALDLFEGGGFPRLVRFFVDCIGDDVFLSPFFDESFVLVFALSSVHRGDVFRVLRVDFVDVSSGVRPAEHRLVVADEDLLFERRRLVQRSQAEEGRGVVGSGFGVRVAQEGVCSVQRVGLELVDCGEPGQAFGRHDVAGDVGQDQTPDRRTPLELSLPHRADEFEFLPGLLDEGVGEGLFGAQAGLRVGSEQQDGEVFGEADVDQLVGSELHLDRLEDRERASACLELVGQAEEVGERAGERPSLLDAEDEQLASEGDCSVPVFVPGDFLEAHICERRHREDFLQLLAGDV